MIIYVTPFRASDKQYTGLSTDSGFASLDQVLATMGADCIKQTPALVIYGDDENRVLFSRTKFNAGAASHEQQG